MFDFLSADDENVGKASRGEDEKKLLHTWSQFFFFFFIKKEKNLFKDSKPRSIVVHSASLMQKINWLTTASPN